MALNPSQTTTTVWSQDAKANGSDIVKHAFDWVSNASGAATLASTLPVSGQILRVVIVPSAVAGKEPTILYDMTLTDEQSIDVLAGQGANLSDTASLNVCPGTPLKDGITTTTMPMVVDGILTLNVSNAGNTKAGRVIVYVR